MVTCTFSSDFFVVVVLFCFVFSPGCPSPAAAQKPSSPVLYQSSDAAQPDNPEPPQISQANSPQPNLTTVSQKEEAFGSTIQAPQKQPVKGQIDDVFTKTGQSLEVAASEEAEFVQSSVVPWPLPPSTNTASIHLEHTKTHTDTDMDKICEDAKTGTHSHESLEISSEKDTKSIPSSKDTDTTNRDSPPTGRVDDSLSRDQQLLEEEKLLLAKIHQLSGDTSPIPCARGMKRLIPAPGDIDSDTTEPKSQLDIHADLVEQNQLSVSPSDDVLQEISLSETEEPLGEEEE